MGNLPAAFKERIIAQFAEKSNLFLEAITNVQAPVSIRINPTKIKSYPQKLKAIDWCQNGFYLPKRPIFTLDPWIHAGAYYVQEASSMVLDAVLKQILDSNPIKILDLCAAPGGKSTLIAAAMPTGSVLVANEVIKSRSGVLAENIQKWSAENTIVTCNDPSHFSKLSEFFDCIVVDAPCSGEGLFRKEPESCNQWSEEAVNLCAQRQKRILAAIWPALSVGGKLIYSTCTYNSTENEEIIKWACDTLGAEEIKINLHPDWGFTQGNPHGIHAYPHQVNGEGFYIAILQKTGISTKSNTKFKFSKNVNQVPKDRITYLKNVVPDLLFSDYRNQLIAFSDDFKEVLSYLDQNLYIVQAGLGVGTFINNELIPDHALALSTSLPPTAFPTIQLQHKEALNYLRKDVLSPQSSATGWHLVQYNGLGLGWMKQLQGRSNNAYPKNWRIQMETKNKMDEELFTLNSFIQ